MSVAAGVQRLASHFADRWNATTDMHSVNLRTRMMLGLFSKIDSSFRCLTKDAEAYRSEAMHHLKTIVEMLIYTYYLADDDCETRSEEVLLSLREHDLAFLSADPEYAAPGEIQDL